MPDRWTPGNRDGGLHGPAAPDRLQYNPNDADEMSDTVIYLKTRVGSVCERLAVPAGFGGSGAGHVRDGGGVNNRLWAHALLEGAA